MIPSAELENETELYFPDFDITLPIEQGRVLISKIENYARKCYNEVEKHKKAINLLKTEEEINSYDFTTNYPNILNLDNV